MNVSVGDVSLEVVGDVVILTLPTGYNLKVVNTIKEKDFHSSDYLNRYGKYGSDIHDDSYSYFSSLGSQMASVESQTSQFY